MSEPPGNPLSLKRSLGLVEITLSGVGIILGAGVYVLIGPGAALAGNALWAAFLVAALIAFLTGLSYAELSSIFPKAGAEFEYTACAFNRRAAFAIGFLVFLSGILAATTVALGFAGYFSTLFPVPVRIPATGVIIVLAAILFLGIRETARAAVAATLVEIAGIVLVVAIGLPSVGRVDYLAAPLGISGVFAAAALIFFAYQGFESMVKFSEETRDPERNVPLALILALVISTALYLLVAVSVVSVAGWEELGASAAPFSDIAGKALGPSGSVAISGIALFATANTVLMSLYASSRILYGMAGSPVIPPWVAGVHPARRTPWAAIAISGILSIAFLFAGDIAFVANATNFTLFVTFIAINAAVVVLRIRSPGMQRPFRIPFAIRGVPVVPVAGIILCIFLISRQDAEVLIFGGLLLAAAAGAALIGIPSQGQSRQGGKN